MTATLRSRWLIVGGTVLSLVGAGFWTLAVAQVVGGSDEYVDDQEFYFTRLFYTDIRGGGGGRFRGRRGSWETDYDDAERHLTEALERLTRLDTSRDGRIVDLRSDALMDYPWLYAVEVGSWYLDEMEAAQLREYLLRGGFLMVDDFHGTDEWDDFERSMKRVFPDRPIVELPETDPLLHVLYDLDQRTQIPGIQYFRTGRTYEEDGFTPHWRGIYDDEDRLMVAINFNMDLGDAWEHANDPAYREEWTGLAYRFAVNYVIYSMTH